MCKTYECKFFLKFTIVRRHDGCGWVATAKSVQLTEERRQLCGVGRSSVYVVPKIRLQSYGAGSFTYSAILLARF